MTDRDETGTDGTSEAGTKADADTFGVGIHVTETELRFVVNVPSDINSGWTDPDAFQQLVERVTWEHLDQQAALRTIATNAPEGETVFLGTVSLQPDKTVVDHSLRVPSFDDA
ncbi:hypothetical protein E6P09_12155 [Haloferax mediterranei ATCC 33500]|uniref:DUF8124 domain-containing protein n=1 Tax=Haloferax mediterranei (strain ATCC 33500 / DSM 1411 / JCM 8866 / NBRC 14739 / NCIMB 2177 / R-4) TaxID=523841 RepID=I3R8N5_HALMT|nr:hypothetical protein [Haloferax mediterranei]AFK20595.1 hypothetical protein HFX_2926 [Haloferax mediterranei ATCC 33500]AHZ23949.1 hypothetical protein BM92_15435 [Haloferax mediterranei ATCC 33500]ELZ98377.1 hypothetical protein C439_16370 [Haloferax mediterranei ATCC 33500]MDX5986650.1 hypothetical protein [Haloferax mediterranei ATCC 33500]QCQ75982.1 hypothetical protein E6P09_12155 [Haloferax mediterranei ATCC 33500]